LVIATLSRLFNVFSSLLVTILCVRLLSVESASLVFMILSFSLVCAQALALGIPEAMMKVGGLPSIVYRYRYAHSVAIFFASLLISILFIGGEYGFIAGVVTFSLLFSVFIGEFFRFKGWFVRATLFNALIFNALIITGVLVVWRFDISAVWVVFIGTPLLFIFYIVMVGSVRGIIVTLSFQAFVKTALAMLVLGVANSLWENIEILYFVKYGFEGFDVVVPVLRLSRGYGFFAIVMAFLMGPSIAAALRKEISLETSGIKLYLGFVILAAFILSIFLYFDHYFLTLLFGRAGNISLDWNQSLIIVQFFKTIAMPSFVYLGFSAPIKIGILLFLLMAIKLILYSFPSIFLPAIEVFISIGVTSSIVIILWSVRIYCGGKSYAAS
jgi:hypothetical protein